MDKVKLGFIGLGMRGMALLRDIVLQNEKAYVTAVCDLESEKTNAAAAMVKEKYGILPYSSLDYRDITSRADVDAVIIATAWEAHIPIAISAMQNGKLVGMEVGGAYSIEQCYDLIKCSENTHIPLMLLENCCYGRRELMVKNMVDQGVLGEIVHCSGGYMHDMRESFASAKEKNRIYRLRNYMNRNCENYPTHELGPIAKILGLNHGNRILTLTSTASKASGLHEYLLSHRSDDPELTAAEIRQGDVITTVIKCAGGETIVLTLDTTLPRFYSRGFTVRGTKGMYEEATDSVFLDGDEHFGWKKNWGNADSYAERYDHPIWKEYLKNGVRGSHDGMDWLEFEDSSMRS